jgi:membrane-bound lytic murein transglycosylase A
MAKPGDTALSGSGYAGTVADWRAVCDSAKGDRIFLKGISRLLRSAARLCSPAIMSRKSAAAAPRSAAFQTPVYGPAIRSGCASDLGLFNPKLKGERISGQGEGPRPGALCRSRPDRHGRDHNSPDPVLHRRSGGFFSSADSGLGPGGVRGWNNARIAYAGETGQAYTAIGRTLIAEGSLTREEVSLQSIRAWLMAHPDGPPR